MNLKASSDQYSYALSRGICTQYFLYRTSFGSALRDVVISRGEKRVAVHVNRLTVDDCYLKYSSITTIQSTAVLSFAGFLSLSSTSCAIEIYLTHSLTYSYNNFHYQ